MNYNYRFIKYFDDNEVIECFKLYDTIMNILLNEKLIEEGIYSDRDLIKKLGKDKTVELILKYSTNNRVIDNNIIKKPKDIFSIKNKFRFFYEYFKFHTKYLEQYNYNFTNSPKNTKTAVIVESRNHIMLKHIINNVMFNLGLDWNLHIFCGQDNYEYINSLYPNIKITLLPFYNFPVEIYDFIFLNKFFWNQIDTEYIMIFQLDTFLISQLDIKILEKYAYVGAPHDSIHSGNSFLTPKGFGLNGGLSFRKKSIMLECINKIKTIDIDNYRKKNNMCKIHRTKLYEEYNLDGFENTDLIYEDVYFSHAIEMLNYNKISNFVAKNIFIQENINGLIYNLNGIHGWDKNYIELGYFKRILSRYTIKLVSSKKIYKNFKKILIICHDMKGGTEKYVQDVINIEKNKYTIFDILRIKNSSNKEYTEIIFNDKDIRLNLSDINFLKRYDIIHINWFIEPAFILYKFIFEILNYFNIKLIITLHDYHLIINDYQNEYHLTIFNDNRENLDNLKKNLINNHKKLLNKANIILTGSRKLKEIYNYIFDLQINLIRVVEHPEKIYFNPIDYLNFDNLNIGVIGAISISKGSYMIQEMSLLIDNNLMSWNIYHIGYGFNYNLKKKNNIKKLGKYETEEELREILIKNKINLLWFPAFRHESHCYTLTLAMQTKIPIIVYDSGTLRDRLTNHDAPYYIHRNNYNCQSLMEDINDFWIKLKNNNNVNDNNNFKYDNFDYNELYNL